MSEPTAYELAKLALMILESHQDFTHSKALYVAHNLWHDANCLVNLAYKGVPRVLPIFDQKGEDLRTGAFIPGESKSQPLSAYPGRA